MMLKNWQCILNLCFILSLCILAFNAGYSCRRFDWRLDRLEQTIWGESQAPEVVNTTLEITGNKYDHTKTMLALRSALAPLIRRVFEDEVIIRAEYEEVRAAYYALRERERMERSIDDAKADLQKALKQ